MPRTTSSWSSNTTTARLDGGHAIIVSDSILVDMSRDPLQGQRMTVQNGFTAVVQARRATGARRTSTSSTPSSRATSAASSTTPTGMISVSPLVERGGPCGGVLGSVTYEYPKSIYQSTMPAVVILS